MGPIRARKRLLYRIETLKKHPDKDNPEKGAYIRAELAALLTAVDALEMAIMYGVVRFDWEFGPLYQGQRAGFARPGPKSQLNAVSGPNVTQTGDESA